MKKLSGHHYAILGAGRSGLGAARLARRLGAEVVVFDDGDPASLQKAVKSFESEGISLKIGLDEARHACGEIRFSMVVISPGLDAGWPLPKIFTDGGVPLIGEMEFAWRELRHIPVVAITGTNGKTTTTELLERIFEGCGKRTIACGNYGLALSEVALSEEPYDVLTLEVSSFQLETIVDFHPQVALWLNFAADHLDRYPDEDTYFVAKRHIFDNMTADDVAIVRKGERLGDLVPKVVTFSTDEGADSDFQLKGTDVWLNGEVIASVNDFPLKERHNIENQMSALAAGLSMGLEVPAMLDALNGYAAARHRCELVRIVNGRRYINDSKATNLHALETCLRSQDEPVVLIIGGKEKGLDYSPLAGLLHAKVAGLVLIGEIADKLFDQFSSLVPCRKAVSVPESVQVATEMAALDQDIVFSPGTSSFDMFSSYVERGNVFCDAVMRLTESPIPTPPKTKP
ncbi:UDP-N-acetylmuramoyl-L-alanine--D-glutamate ligase [Phragmitibacter flavus]|uniref:UDP-N-acetylmuramoylalanine--D-glutamate ligase n=1 Tax=Phragmitibacter flavus TaxID=2576071 RepID=A0A5R8K9L2_9BACT|nr:UDP-N-acetylmuramoyl-L-alanine--D-glutamate ligase [Phragmitibacter flavus]TLD68990.1 UDP-N-acetylmuramoyl-L-alanine--D-glutamate ligase [Phragmitibacter flavus]